MDEELKWIGKHYGRLVGARIVRVEATVDDGEYGTGDIFPVLVCRYGTGAEFKVEVDRDPEGNGAGFLRFF